MRREEAEGKTRREVVNAVDLRLNQTSKRAPACMGSDTSNPGIHAGLVEMSSALRYNWKDASLSGRSPERMREAVVVQPLFQPPVPPTPLLHPFPVLVSRPPHTPITNCLGLLSCSSLTIPRPASL